MSVAERLEHPDHDGHDAEDLFFLATEATVFDAAVVDIRTYEVAQPDAHANPPADPPSDEAGDAGSGEPRDKMHPQLRRWLRERGGDEREQLLVVFTDQPAVPRFPRLVPGEPRESPRNAERLERARALVQAIRAQRATQYRDLLAELRAVDPAVRILDEFWLISGVLISAPLRAVEGIARRESVLTVEPRFAHEKPPGNAEIDDGRAAIRSDPYFDLGLPATTIALLDTGVRRTHVLLDAPSNLDLVRDCVNGGQDCNTGNGLDAGDVGDHGTATAAILTGNASQGFPFRGVTGASVDSLRVYERHGELIDLDHDAARRGFELATGRLVRVVVAEMAAEHDHFSALAVAANSAFDSGAVVIAPNGNTPGPDTVGSPASAQRAIGVGAFDIVTTGQFTQQSCGPTADGRIKPDLQGPTNTDSASSASNTATLNLGGTSCATPYVGGAAALLCSWLDAAGSSDPGQVYAQLILFGRNDPPFNNTSGAGHLQLRTNGVVCWGKVSVGHGDVIDVPVAVTAGAAGALRAAIWWPEKAVDANAHNTITLAILDGAGSQAAASSSPGSVFQRCRAKTGSAGTWVLRVKGAAVPTPQQTVYWAAFLDP